MTDQSKGVDEKEMPFFDHLEELRWHIIRAVSSILVFGIIVFVFKEFVFSNIIFSLQKEDFPTYRFFCSMSEATCIGPANLDIVPIKLGSPFFIHLRVSFWLGFIASFPYIFWEIWRFIKPGLYDNEQTATRGAVFVCSFLFFLGVLFGYFVIAPFGFKFLGDYTLIPDEMIKQTVSLSSYVSYLTNFTIPAGILFQMPVAVYLFARIGILTPDFMKKYRKHALVAILLIAAIITPPDVVTQVLIGIPVLILYEASIVIAGRAQAKYHKTD